MGLLYGVYELTIDDKNRLSIPADIRKAILPERDGNAFFLTVGVNRKPWLYAERYYEDLASQRAAEIAPGEDMLAFDHLTYAMAAKIPWDKQGRIGIPEKMLRRMEISREVTLVGARDHLELWNRDDWEARAEELDRRRPEITLKAKQSPQMPQ